MKACFPAALGLFALFAATGHAQVPPDKALATFQVNDPDLELTLWASEPQFANPTSMDIDHLGRVWVCEAVNYRQILRNRPVLRPEGDRILILEDSKGEGKADKVTVFAQAPYIQAPLGIAVAKEPAGPGWKVYVCQSPDILLFEDKDGDGKADGEPKKLLSGFKGLDHDHGVHGILIGPDGKLYFSVGDQGVDGLKDKNGKVWKTNRTDCQGGTIWRCDMDGSNLEFIAHNFRNQYEPAVNSFGDIWVSDNDDDGNQQTRICYVMPGGNYGYWPRGPGQTHWHEEQPGVVPKVLRTYFGSPTGMCFYEGTLLPKKYQGQLLHTEAGPRHLRCYHIKPHGAGYEIDRQDLVTSTDNWFRPSDVCVAPDGSVFIADWYDPGVGGHGMGDTTRGRIHRLSSKGNKYQVPKVDLASKDGVLAALGSPCLATRAVAITAIRRWSDREVNLFVRGMVESGENPLTIARAFWHTRITATPHESVMPAGREEAFRRLLGKLEEDPRSRVQSKRTLVKDSAEYARVHGKKPQDVILELLHADLDYNLNNVPAVQRHPMVFREMALALQTLEPERAAKLFFPLAKLYDGKDRFYLAALGIAVGTDPKRREDILADFDKHFPDWNERTANLIWELRPPSVMPRLEQKLFDAATPAAQRAQIVDILAGSDDVAAGRLLVRVLGEESAPDVRQRIVSHLKLFLPGKWRDLRGHAEMGLVVDRLIKRAETAVIALNLVAVAERLDFLEQVRQMAANAATPAAARAEAIRTLGALHVSAAVTALDKLITPAEPAVCQTAIQALGQHLDFRRNSRTAQPALAVLQKVFLGKELTFPLDVRQAALAELTGSRVGMQWLLHLQATRAVPDDLMTEAGRLARNTPFQDLRNRALIAFPAPAKIDLTKLPAPAVLATRKGDAVRGKEVMAASLKNDLQCLKCHAVQGAGGSVGPDLSMIGKKASRENLFESLLAPGKAIADQFVQWQVATTRGVVLSGLIVEETADAVTIRDANGKDTRIPRSEIDTRDKVPTSLMPDNLAGTLTEQELVDLVEYMTTLQTPAISPSSWRVAGPFPNGPGDEGLEKDYGPEKGIDLQASYPGGKAGPVRWRTVTADAQGYVDLRAYHESHGPQSVTYLTRAVNSPAEQEVRILLGTDDGAKLWVNGQLVHTSRQHRAAAPGQDTVTVKLRPGRNELLLKVANGEGLHGFFLTLLSGQELQAE
jgi:putative membrane-bound dehydrogenase-like protein